MPPLHHDMPPLLPRRVPADADRGKVLKTPLSSPPPYNTSMHCFPSSQCRVREDADGNEVLEVRPPEDLKLPLFFHLQWLVDALPKVIVKVRLGRDGCCLAAKLQL